MMKRKYAFSILCIPLVLACLVTAYFLRKGSEITDDIYEYLPQRKMIKVFDGGFENAGFIHIIDQIDNDRVQIKTLNAGTGFLQIYRWDSRANIVKNVYIKRGLDMALFNFNGMNKEENVDQILLIGPIKIGTKWRTGSIDYEITGIDHRLSTPVGNYDTMVITGETSDGLVTKKYYSKDVGLVKEQIGSLTSTLRFISYDLEEYNNFNKIYNLITE